MAPVLAPDRIHLINSWLTRPKSPHPRRKYGFGIPTIGRSTTYDQPNPLFMLHHVWNFLTISDRSRCVQVAKCWNNYAKLRADAVTTSVALLQSPRPCIPEKEYPTKLDLDTAHMHSLVLLLRFDFLHGDLVRWFDGEFTNNHRDYQTEWLKHLSVIDSVVPPRDCPPVNPVAAFRVQTEGVPLKANYVTPSTAPVERDKYDNHPAVDKIEAKFAKEEWKRYHIHFHHWLYPFIDGLIINPIQWVFDKGKGRICIDGSHGPDEKGSVNTHIPKPFNAKKKPKTSEPPLDYDECPPTFFKYAFKRVLWQILRMRVTKPDEPILVHADDVDAAFRRILYHPDLAVAFAYLYTDFLIVPVSQIFGGRSSPPYYGLLADVRELLAIVRPLDDPRDHHPLVQNSDILIDDSTPLVQVGSDSHFPPLNEDEMNRPFQASYVDDMATVAYPAVMKAAVNNSVQAAFDVFGRDADRRGDCLQMQKWVPELSEKFMFLGFELDTRNMTVTWPRYKRQALHDEITEILGRKKLSVSAKEMSHLL